MNAWSKTGNIRGAAGGTFPDAPPDGTVYGRKDSAWEPVATPADVSTAVDAEAAVRASEDALLATGIADEEAARIAADTALSGDIDAEEAARIAADALKADTTYVDSQNAAQDAVIATKANTTYVDAQDALKAPLASPALTGNPTAPTPTAGDNDTSIATTAFVQTAAGTGGWADNASIGDTDKVAGFNNAGARVKWTWATIKEAARTYIISVANTLTAKLTSTAGPTPTGSTISALTAAAVEVQTSAGNAGPAVIAFHRAGAFASYFGIDTDNKWKVGGWSMGASAYQIIHEGVEATFTGTGFVKQAQPTADTIVANAYTPAITGKGNMRLVTVQAAPWTFNPPPATTPASDMFTMVIATYQPVTSGAITFAGFAKVSGDTPNLAAGKWNICYITRALGQTTIHVDAAP